MSEFSKEELLDCFDNMCLFLAMHGWVKKDKRVVEIRELIKNRVEMNKAYCKDCKWFKTNSDHLKFGLCDNPIFEEQCGDISGKALFVYWDGDCYSAGFYVHESFGCIGFSDHSSVSSVLPED